MALFQGNITSISLGMNTQLWVSLPHDGFMTNGEAKKTLLLLHGLSGNASDWVRCSRIDMLAGMYGVAVIMPEVQKSVYTNMMFGGDYYSYVAEELPVLAGKMFGIPTERENMMVAGLSMGGYGALRVAFGNPKQFSMVGCFSGGPDMQSIIHENRIKSKEFAKWMYAVYGPTFELGDDNEIYKLVDKAVKSGNAPQVYSACGTEDGVFQQNADFVSYCETQSLNIKFDPMPGGHEWAVWNVAVENMLKHFLGEPPEPFWAR